MTWRSGSSWSMALSERTSFRHVAACLPSVAARVVVFASRRGAERPRAQRSIGLIDELLPAEVDRQSKREIHGDKIRFEMSPALSFPVVVSISLSALSASPRSLRENRHCGIPRFIVVARMRLRCGNIWGVPCGGRNTLRPSRWGRRRGRVGGARSDATRRGGAGTARAGPSWVGIAVAWERRQAGHRS